MSDIASHSDIAIPASRLEPQRMAWGVLLMSFAIFCALCVVTGLGVQWFLFQSTIPLVSRMEVGRGTVGITLSSDPREQVARVEYDLSGAVDTTVSTDAQSQAAISFFDADRLVATVTLRSNTSLDLREAVRPRFDWSSNRYDIVLESFAGGIEIFVADNLERNLQMGVRTTNRHWLIFDSGGNYVANASSSQVSVINLDGTAVLIPPDSTEGGAISPGYQAVSSSDYSEVVLSSIYTDLLSNTIFPEDSEINGSPDETAADLWVCTSGENDNPRGDYGTELIEGRIALRLVRGDETTENHGETRCIKWFGQNRFSLDGYDYVALHATFNINEHSLNACGVAGSECPLMLQLDYIDVEDEGRRWFYGFYSRDSLPGYPLRCNTVTCVQDHQQINPQSWFTFDSGNLFDLFRQNQLPLPKSIVSVHFYASGHQYDVYISDLALLVGQNTQTNTDEAAPALAG